jgi:hypothetical protein
MPTAHPETVLRRRLREEGRSGNQVAAWLGMNRQTVNAWVRGAEACPRRRQAQLATLLDEPPNALFDADGYARKDAS